MAALTNAERQAKYRERHLKDPDGQGERIAMVATIQTKARLERLSHWYGTTQREALSNAIKAAEDRILDALPNAQHQAFYNKAITAADIEASAKSATAALSERDRSIIELASGYPRPSNVEIGRLAGCSEKTVRRVLAAYPVTR